MFLQLHPQHDTEHSAMLGVSDPYLPPRAVSNTRVLLLKVSSVLAPLP